MIADMRLVIPAAVLLVASSALSVVVVKHESRKLFVELQALERKRDDLNVHWSRVKLEGGYWASHARVQTYAEERLDMDRPSPERVVIIDIEY